MEWTSAFVSSGDSGKKQESLAEYEKDYLERLQNIKEEQNLQNLIFNFSKDVKNPETTVTNVDYVGHCKFCMMGVPRKEMIFKNSQLFHSNCFEQQGKNFPAPNQEFLELNSKAKVELVQLKNLKIRKMGSSNPDSAKPKTKTKKKSKRKTKKRSTKRKRTTTKRKKTKKKTSRKKPSKSKRTTKRRTSPKRKKATRKTKRIVSRKTKRKTRRRR